MRIVIVEDDHQTVDALIRALDGVGDVVVANLSSLEAARAGCACADVVLLDYDLAGVTSEFDGSYLLKSCRVERTIGISTRWDRNQLPYMWCGKDGIRSYGVEKKEEVRESLRQLVAEVSENQPVGSVEELLELIQRREDEKYRQWAAKQKK